MELHIVIIRFPVCQDSSGIPRTDSLSPSPWHLAIVCPTMSYERVLTNPLAFAFRRPYVTLLRIWYKLLLSHLRPLIFHCSLNIDKCLDFFLEGLHLVFLELQTTKRESFMAWEKNKFTKDLKAWCSLPLGCKRSCQVAGALMLYRSKKLKKGHRETHGEIPDGKEHMGGAPEDHNAKDALQ